MEASSRDRPVIAVLSTSFGGPYFGSLLAGMAGATRAAGGRIVAVQTLDAGTFSRDVAEPPPFRHRVGWRHVSGFAVILNAVNEEYLGAIREAGKPVVMVSDSLPGFDCPVVLPENHAGVASAVEHLIRHGHRKIAFAGNPAQKDVRERYLSYQRTLLRHGVEIDPQLFYDTGNNQESGGDAAARAMIAGGLPSTAVVTGNDFNAIGLMRTLAEAGYELPRQQAVVGFDDLEAAAYLSPSLSSVRQPFQVIGATAAGLLLDRLAGREVADRWYHVPTEFVARESCGCPGTPALAGRGAAGAVPGPVQTCADLTGRLGALVGGGTGAADSAGAAEICATGVTAICAALQAAVEDRPAPPVATLRTALAALYGLRPQTECLSEITRCVREYGRHLAASGLAPDDTVGRYRVEDCVQEVILALAQAQERFRFGDMARFERAFRVQQAVSMGLLRSGHEEDPRRLGWLQRTPARAACLGLWQPHPTDPESDSRGDPPGDPEGGARLEIAGVFDPAGTASVRAAGSIAVEAFPPAELVALADLGADEMLFVAPMKVDTSDWGLFAVVGPIEAGSPVGREIMNQWTAMLTIALDHGAVLDALRIQEERLRRAALYDELTGLPNRTLFFDRLKYAISRAQRRSDYRFGVFLLDLDGFKIVNDSLGHLAGDRLLVEVAGRIQSSLRSTDVAARFGGDEFAVLLDDLADAGGAAAVAERLRTRLAAPCTLDGQEIVVTASIGVTLSGNRYDHPEDVIRDADIAMYTAKTGDKGTHAIFDVAMHARAVGRLRTEGELRRALDQGELELFYQPVVDLATGTAAAFEALVRWRHPERGVLLPGTFLPVAEECGLMLPIGRWILGEACRQLAAWRHAGIADGLRVSVNVSNRQFWHGRLPGDLAECLCSAGLEPRYLGVEITEGVIMHDVKLARRTLDELHGLGVELQIDDFGTGYSSLEALHVLPLDALKIDKSFVAPLGNDPRSEELVRTIIAMGANLGLSLIAEGIERPEHRDLLRDLGCGYGQGFWFSPPVPAGAAATLVAGSLPAAPHLVP